MYTTNEIIVNKINEMGLTLEEEIRIDKNLKDLDCVNRSAKITEASDKYSVVNTMKDIIVPFVQMGFSAKLIAKEKPRLTAYKSFETHIVGFEKSLDGDIEAGNKIRIYVKNSHHRRTRVEFYVGLLRGACSNGLVFGKVSLKTSKKHMGITKDYLKEMIDEVYRMYQNILNSKIEALRNYQMSHEEALSFAKTMLDYRVDSQAKGENYIGGSHDVLLRSNRFEDNANSAWHILNRVQENLGLNYRGVPHKLTYDVFEMDADNNKVIKTKTVRCLKGIKAVTSTNEYLFEKIFDYVSNKDKVVA